MKNSPVGADGRGLKLEDVNTELIADLRRIATRDGLVFQDDGERVRFNIARSRLSVSILVPHTVLELSIEVNVPHTGQTIRDWLDYAGYEATPEHEVAANMRVDVLQFIERISTRELRLANGGRTLEWKVADRWSQAVPFVPDI